MTPEPSWQTSAVNLPAFVHSQMILTHGTGQLTLQCELHGTQQRWQPGLDTSFTDQRLLQPEPLSQSALHSCDLKLDFFLVICLVVDQAAHIFKQLVEVEVDALQVIA